MSARKQRVVWPQEANAEAEEGQGSPSDDSRPAATAAAATAAQPGSPGPTYRIMYSSEDSFSDGELHVERHAGSVTAWYQHGAASRGGSPRKTPREPGGSDGEDEGAPLRGSVTVVLHDDAAAASGAREGGGAAGKQETNGMVSWETNNLYDYLRGLQQAGEDTTGEMDSKEWGRRIGALRQVLRERDGEVAELQRLLEKGVGELEGRDAELAQQGERVAVLEQRIAELEQHIRQLVRQLEVAQAGSSGKELPHIRIHSGEQGVAHTMQKRQLAPAAVAFTPAQPDSYCLQLPAQSYAEHQGCGWWQSTGQAVMDSVQHHPRRWAVAAAALLLLLLILLCATLVPAARRRGQRPAFLEAPSVAGAGASWVDLSVRLDRPGVLSYMAFRQSDLNTPVPGMGRTLLELIQGEDVQARAVYAASAPAYALDPGNAPQAALQSLAVACGWAPVADASSDGSRPAAWVSVLSATGGASTACAPAAATAPGRCARCPILVTGTAYTLLLVAASGKGLSGVQMVNAVTGDASVNVNSLEPPYTANITERGFDLYAKMNVPGTLYYAVAHSQMYATYGSSLLAFGQLTPPATAVTGADPGAFTGGLVAAGSVEATAAGEWVNAVVLPPCVGALCAQSQWGLQGGTPYTIFLVAVDTFGTADPAPVVLTVTTAPATSAPALLPGSQPANITDSGFGVAVSQDAAGGVYYTLLLANPGVGTTGGSVPAGSWGSTSGLSPSSTRRRLTAAAEAPALGSVVQRHLRGEPYRWQRQLLQNPAAPGSLVAPTCYPANRTCTQTPAAVFAGTAGLAGNFAVVTSGCLPAPAAGQPLALPPFSGLQNNTLYHLMLSTEDTAVPLARRLQPPAVFAVRTVDLSAPQLACGFPVATNITATSFSLAAMLTKPGASAFYVVLPAAAAAAQAPSALEVLRGTAAGGASATAAGNMTQWGTLPWEAAGSVGNPRKLWGQVAGLQPGANYTAFMTVSADGTAPVPGAPVAVLSGILTPTTVPPTFTRLEGINATVDELRGTFSVQLSAGMDRPGVVYFAMYRNYSCIRGDPPVSDIVAGNPLPSGVCTCEDASYCTRVSSGSFLAPAQGAVRAVGGDLSPLPFQSLANATDAQLKCFQGGLGQATDTYNIYVVASNALPTYTGLAPQCSNFAQAAAAAAATAAGGDADGSCPAAPQLSCSQAQLRPDTQTLQSGAVVAWRSGLSSSSNSSSSETWQPPVGVATTGRPARVQLSLEGGAPPAFTMGPLFTPALRNASSFGMQFALDKPALLIYAVFRPMPIDASGSPQAPVLIATGRVPVFDASTNATTGPIAACPWAPGGTMQPDTQFFINFVARDKYARMDGLCPGQLQGSATRVCADLAYTGS